MKTVYRSSIKRDGDLKNREEQNYIMEMSGNIKSRKLLS